MKITLKKSLIGKSPTQRKTLIALGLKKINQTINVDENNKSTQGMIRKISHMVTIEK